MGTECARPLCVDLGSIFKTTPDIFTSIYLELSEKLLIFAVESQTNNKLKTIKNMKKLITFIAMVLMAVSANAQNGIWNPSTSSIIGDLNGDNKVNAADVVILVDHILYLI